MAFQIALAAESEAEAWAALDLLAKLDPWCLEIDGVEVHALFARRPAVELPPGAREVAAAVGRFGSGWRERERATRVGPLWIVPPERAAPSGAQVVLRIDALKAFGAGTHPTTLMCLEMIVARSPLGSVLDVGTGSGVLAIAALKLGATSAAGVDLEPALLDEAARNAARNGVAIDLSLELPAGSYDLVIANVRTPALIALAPALLSRARGPLVLSGIREEERDELVPVYTALGARIELIAARDEWLCLVLASHG